MNDNPDVQIAKLKTEGKSNKEIAEIVYPELPSASGVVKVSRHLNKGEAGQYIEQTKTIALKKYGMTWDRIMKKLDSKMDATKSDFHTGELIDDNPTQMQALKQLIDLLKEKPTNDNEPLNMANLPSGISEVQLVRLFKNN